jgi:hypothetical protein
MRWLIFTVIALLSSVALSEDVLWGVVDITKWKDTPCVFGRLSTERDVKEGRAAFYISGDPGQLKPIRMPLPACAIYHDSESKKAVPVILIQAEETPKLKAIGFRFLNGGNGVCALEELEILPGPDERFK